MTREHEMPVRMPTVLNFGLYANHDQACAVCSKNHAVYQCQSGIFEPCWECQSKGWSTTKRRDGFWRALINRPRTPSQTKVNTQ